MTAVGQVLRIPDVRRVQTGYGLALAGATASTVAFLVYAYDAGGAALVAWYGIARTLPGAVVAPLVMSLSDRVGVDRLLLFTSAARAVLLSVAAVLAAGHGPSWAVIGLAGAGAALAGTFRPLQAAALPWLVRTPSELTAANVGATVMENAASLLGPLLAGALLVVRGAASVMVLSAGFLVAAAVALVRLRVPVQDVGPVEAAPAERSRLHSAGEGARALVGVGRPGGLAALAFGQTFVRGALLVLLVVLALDVLALGDDSIGWLNAAIGLGGLLGGVVAGATLRANRLGRSFVTGVALWGLPLVLLAAVPTPATAYLALVVVGIGNTVEDASMFTLLPRAVGARLAGRTLGALELVVFVGVGAGSALTPLLLDLAGPRGLLAALGAALLVLVAAYTRSFVVMDRATPPPGPGLALLQGQAMLAPLPLVVVEHLAAALEPRSYHAGETVIREGEGGDRFFIVESGRATVTVSGRPRPDLGPGDGFGEVALLRDVPRTATVTAADALVAQTLSRAEFQTAVLGNRASHAVGQTSVDDLLTADAADRRAVPP